MLEKKPKIESGQPQESGKLTLEEIKEMVEKYKKEHEGLLPEYFSLPGEENEEKRQYSEETILAYEIKEFLEEIRPKIENRKLIKNAEEWLKSFIKSGKKSDYTVEAGRAVWGYALSKQSGLWSKFNHWIEENIKNSQLIKNAEEWLKSKIEFGQKLGKTGAAWDAVYEYASFKQSGLWFKLSRESQDWIEEKIKNPQLIKNAEKELKTKIEDGQKPVGEIYCVRDTVYGYASFKQSDLWFKFDQEFRDWAEENIKNPQLIKKVEERLKYTIDVGQERGETLFAWNAVWGYASLVQFQKILEEEGRRKEIAKESQKAMHPEKKLPPIPEEKAF